MNVMSKSSLNLGPNCSPGTREEAPAPLTVLRVVSLTRNSLKWLPRSLGGHQALLSTIPVQGGELGPCPGCGTDPCCAQPQGLRRRAAEPPERPRRVPRAARVPALPHHLPGPPPLQHLQVSPLTSAMGGCGTTDPAPSTGMGIPAPGSALRCYGSRTWVWGTQLSPVLLCRTIYRVAYRQRYRQLPEPTASCCPGWSRANGHRLGCNRGKELLGHPCATAHPQTPCVSGEGPRTTSLIYQPSACQVDSP